MKDSPYRTAERVVAIGQDLRRALRRHVAADAPEDALSLAQSELLHDIAAHPGSGVGDAAARLGLAANTVSGLVRTLVGTGLLKRQQDPADGRAARLYITGERALRRDRRNDERIRIAHDVLDSLEPDEQASLIAALPAFEKLIARIRERTAEDAVPADMADRE